MSTGLVIPVSDVTKYKRGSVVAFSISPPRSLLPSKKGREHEAHSSQEVIYMIFQKFEYGDRLTDRLIRPEPWSAHCLPLFAADATPTSSMWKYRDIQFYDRRKYVVNKIEIISDNFIEGKCKVFHKIFASIFPTVLINIINDYDDSLPATYKDYEDFLSKDYSPFMKQFLQSIRGHN